MKPLAIAQLREILLRDETEPPEPTQAQPYDDDDIKPGYLGELLQDALGINKLKDMQRRIVGAAVQNHDIIAILPTGYGKSIVYQLPAILDSGKMTIVIQPLKALILDQLRSLSGLVAQGIHVMSCVDSDSLLLDPMPAILYTTPDKLPVDEAHCVQTDEYRPALTGLEIRKYFPNTPISLFSATLTPPMTMGIIQKFDLKQPHVYRMPPLRPNLAYHVSDNWRLPIETIIKDHAQKNHCGIIFCRTVKECTVLFNTIEHDRWTTAAIYHAQLPQIKKEEAMQAWFDGHVKVMIATSAFGLGINKPDVRFIIHKNIPMARKDTMLQYFQQCGRAGRDHYGAHCYLLIELWECCKILADLNPESEEYQSIRHMVDYCCNKHHCRQALLGAYFDCAQHDILCHPSNLCDNCSSHHRVHFADNTYHAETILALYQKMARAVSPLNCRIFKGQLLDIYNGKEPSRCKNEWKGIVASANHNKYIAYMPHKKAENILGHLILQGYFILIKTEDREKKTSFYLQRTSLAIPPEGFIIADFAEYAITTF